MRARFEHHGSVCLFTPLDPDAESWVAEHVSDDAQIWGANSTVVEPRYAADLLAGFVLDGGAVTR